MMAHIATPQSTEPAMTDPTQRRFRGSAKISEYEVMNEKLGEGTFGVVSKARSKRTGNMVALKKILMHNEKEGFPITALREVKLLKMLCHPNILRLEEMAVERQQVDDKGKSGKKRATLYMVTPYMEHDLSGMLTNPDIRLSEAQVKCYMLQLLEGLRYLHDSHILHRDMKAANILISNRGSLLIADFGLARNYEGQPPQSGRGNGEAVRDYTSLVVTRWYRPPELLLTLKRYTPAIDMWGVGCVFAEMFERKPILEGKTDVDQCVRIFQLVGSPNDTSMPGWSDLPGCEGNNQWDFQKGDIDKRFGPRLGQHGLSLLRQLLCLDWRVRINAVDALQHPYFKTAPLPARPEDLPQYEDSHELDARRRGHEKQRALPPAPAGGTVGMGPDEWQGGSGPPMNNGYAYNDRPRGGYGRDRDHGPPGGYPPRGYDDRRPPPGDSRQGWRNDRPRGPPPPTNGHALPPRPDMPGRGPPPPRNDRPRGGAPDVYIPSYSGADRPSSRGSRDDGYHDPDAPPPRDRPAYRDPDAPGGGRRDERPPYRGPEAPGGGRGYDRDERPYRDPDAPRRDDRYRDDRGGYRRDDREQRRTRSRSPVRDRDRDGRPREDDVRRERLQNRERELYRR